MVHQLHQRQEATDQGLLMSPEETLRYFGLVEPLRADSVALDPIAGRFAVRITDAQARSKRVFFQVSPDSVMASSYWEPGSTLRLPAGQPEDRLNITLVSLALRSEQDTVGATQDQQYRTELRELIEARTRRILEADARE